MNRKNRIVFIIFPALLGALCGCTHHAIEVAPVKTEHEIKPIHITMDINLKVVDQDVDHYTKPAASGKDAQKAKKDNTKEALRARFLARTSVIADLKKRGIIGENASGFLSFVTTKTEKKEIVREENRDRRIIYTKIAEKRNATRDEIASRRAITLQQRALPGEYILKDGKWTKK